MVLDNDRDLESSYIKIPSKAKATKRVKTNLDSSIAKQSSEVDSLKIR